MSLVNNEVFVQAAIGLIGVIVGALLTYLFTIRNENRREERARKKETEQKKIIASLIRHELDFYSRFIQTAIGTFEDRVKKDDLIANYKILPNHYIGMSPEVKAKVFDIYTIEIVERAYRHLQMFMINVDAVTSIGSVKPGDYDTLFRDLKDNIDRASQAISNMKLDKRQ